MMITSMLTLVVGPGRCILSGCCLVLDLIREPGSEHSHGPEYKLITEGPHRSSQVALLGISSVKSASGTSTWLILLLPILFTAGMCLLDTTDGALMLALYTSPAKSSSRPSNRFVETAPASAGPYTSQPHLDSLSLLALLYTNIILTALTVLIALVIGTLQVLSLVESVLGSPSGKFWDGVDAVEDRYDVVGGAICGAFAIVGIIGFWAYPRWKRWAAARAGIPIDGTTPEVGGNHGGETERCGERREEGLEEEEQRHGKQLAKRQEQV